MIEPNEWWRQSLYLPILGLAQVLLLAKGFAYARILGPSDFGLFSQYLLIGNAAIDFARGQSGYEIWDLGTAWFEMTKLPFVYAVWALRRGVDNARLRRLLREARDFGMDTLENVINSRTEYDLDFRKDYLGWHIHYHLGADEKRGVQRFIELMEKHGLGPLFPPHYVS